MRVLIKELCMSTESDSSIPGKEIKARGGTHRRKEKRRPSQKLRGHFVLLVKKRNDAHTSRTRTVYIGGVYQPGEECVNRKMNKGQARFAEGSRVAGESVYNTQSKYIACAENTQRIRHEFTQHRAWKNGR